MNSSTAQFILGIVIVIGLWWLSQSLYVLPVHVTAFFVTICFVAVADIHAVLWLVGKLPMLSRSRMVWLHRIVSYGLLVSVVTGALMAWPVWEYLIGTPAFIIKMIFVAALIVNSYVIGTHLEIACTRPCTDLAPRERRVLLFSGAISTVSWLGAFTAAQFLGL